jgi:hypothetical protein
MTTSNSTTFNPVRDLVIKGALRLVNAYASTGQPSPDQINDALESLNMLLKSWQVEGFLWLKQFATLFVEPGQSKYLLPGDHCTAQYVETTVTTDGGTYPAVNITVAKTTGMTALDTIGVVLDSGVIFWDTITSVTNGTDLVLTTGLPSESTAGAVYSYTKGIDRPTRITNPTRQQSGGTEIPMGETGTISREEYNSITNKTTTGTPLMLYYDPQLSVGNLYMWPVPSDCTTKIRFTCDRPIQDMISDTDTFDVPQEQVRRIKYALALEIAPEYAMPAGDYDRLAKRYDGIKQALDDYDREVAPTQMMMGYR